MAKLVQYIDTSGRYERSESYFNIYETIKDRRATKIHNGLEITVRYSHGRGQRK